MTIQIPRNAALSLGRAAARPGDGRDQQGIEAFNGFSDWVRFGNRGVITDNDPVEQGKAVKFNALLRNCLIFHNILDIAQAVRELQAEGWKVEPEDLAEVSVSPYLTEKIMRFGEYSTHELDLAPEAYEQHLDVDFAKLDPQDQAGTGQ
ncbi:MULTISPECIES: Tn3 family transposase [unclassified Streptomyces]|uniref:Tn3 family transposase n=1 Tax=unclassified Streptomyces TaxID=2593676 RepID=UPI000DADD132|nr:MULTISPECIES: Tn3 family transposase [unclassified Streptomyces]PZT73799.1 hypothetical protein DNK55_16450 [Streptomyces sp. AC1-42T]PZT83204.1 hypothetical protein DNK56_14975 [Streptomyces sp. AC1-42W]